MADFSSEADASIVTLSIRCGTSDCLRGRFVGVESARPADSLPPGVDTPVWRHGDQYELLPPVDQQQVVARIDPYLRTLLIHGARSVLYHSKTPTPWLKAIQERRPANVAAVAVASKMARTAWAILARGQAYERDHVSMKPA